MYTIFKLANNHAKLSLKKFQQATATQLLEKAAPLAVDAPVRRSVGSPPANPVERLESNKHLIDWVKDDQSFKFCSGPGNLHAPGAQTGLIYTQRAVSRLTILR